MREIKDIINIALFLLFLVELMTIGLFGGYVSKRHYPMVEDHISRCTFNYFSQDILNDYENFYSGKAILRIRISVMCKYAIYSYGIVPRWSKLHKLIEKRKKYLRNEKRNGKDHG